MPTTTSVSGLIERFSLRAYSGVQSGSLRCDFGSANKGSFLGRAASCSGVRLTIHTGLPRHSTVSFSPGLIPEISTSTAAPVALAFSDGCKLLTRGTATAATPMPPTAQVATIQFLLSLSKGAPCGTPFTLAWVMRVLQELA